MTATTVSSPSNATLPVALRLTAAQLRVLFREPMVTVGTIAFPALTVLVLAGVFGKLPDPDFGGVAPSGHYFVGYIGVVLAAMGLLTIPVHLASQRELGVLRRFRASGLTGGTVVASEIALGTVLGTIAVAVVLLLGQVVYGLPAPLHPFAVLGWFLAGMACFIAIGGALGTLVRTSRAATAIGNLLFVPMLLLGGGGPPRAVMTPIMRAVSNVLPLSHVVGGLRHAWLGTTGEPHALWWPILVAAIAVATAVRVSRRRAV
jgi:ABC-2 type transport system permease protein